MVDASPSGAAPLPVAPLAGLSRDQLVAASSSWVAVSLNLGCQGMGYVYQRRWGAFWLGGCAAVAAAAVLAFGAGIAGYSLAGERKDRDAITTASAMVAGYVGWFAVGLGSAVEAGVATTQARRRLQAGPEA